MEKSAPVKQILRFGIFEVDLRSGELRKNGFKVRLSGQPFDVLAMLLERPGEVVTREQIQQRLWPEGTFVDFDHSLNITINKIREALGDSAENPRFVETLVRRGYRFIAPVQRVEQISRPIEATQPIDQTVSQRDWRWLRAVVASGIFLAVVLLIAFVWWNSPRPRIVGSSQITDDGRLKSIFATSTLPTPNLPTSNHLVTDGPRIYFNYIASNRVEIGQVSADGGETVKIPTPFEMVVTDAYAAGSVLLISRTEFNPGESTLWVLQLGGGPPRRLDLRGWDAAWSPDGQAIVYASGQALFRSKRDGTGSRQLSSVPGWPRLPRWSPDGTRVRFTLLNPETQGDSLWEVRSDGTGLHPLLPGWNNPPAECCGNWTPDGKYFVFQSTRGTSANIWAINERGNLFRKISHEPVQLTSGPMNFRSPVPSRDGKKLFVMGEKRRGELVRYDAKLEQFVPYLSGISAEHVDFSRDGGWVTYVAIPGSTVWRSKLDGSQRLQLTFPPLQAYMPRWSPDKKQVAFFGDDGKTSEIFLISADGGHPRQLMLGDGLKYDPTWSPDGNRLMFGLDWEPTKKRGIYQVDLITQQISKLPGSEQFCCPRQSPDGRLVAAMKFGSWEVVVFDFNTTKWERRAPPATHVTWSPDGKCLYFDDADNFLALSRLRISDSKIERLLSLKGLQLTTNYVEEAWSGVTPDGSRMVARDAGTTEIYALDWVLP